MAAIPVAGTPGLDCTLPDVPLIIGGKVRQLCYDFAAIQHVERATGINLLKSAVSAPSFSVLAALLWASLLRDDPELTLEEVGKLVTFRNSPVVHAAILACWVGSSSEPEEPKKGRARGKKRAQTTPTA